ncbi:MAG TPA: MFS transporter [Devosia sp.]|nr:MFS transporter [Devosia sp.]
MNQETTTPVPSSQMSFLVKRNISLLAIAQAITGSNQALIAAVGGLAGASLAPTPALATVPITAQILGLALTTIPATYAIHHLGRRNGFILGAGLAIFGGLAASYALVIGSFVLFCAALVLVGASAAFGQQYRFAAADSVPEMFKARAISFVLLGGILAGFLGPRLSFVAKDWVRGVEFSGSFLVISVLGCIAIAVLWFTRLAPVANTGNLTNSGRTLRQLLRSPEIFVPVAAGMATYALMTFAMVAAPLAMVLVCGHSVETATTAIQWHVVAMFAPSFITGHIINKIGAHLTAGLGLFLILLSAVTALNGVTEWHFYAGLVLLGVGWNFGFIGSTTLLTSAYGEAEAARAQGLNEQLVFGTMAVASIGSGVLLQLIGWQAVNILVIPVATATIALLAWGDHRTRLLREAGVG